MTEPVEGSLKVVNVNTIPSVSDLAQKCVIDVVVTAPGMARVSVGNPAPPDAVELLDAGGPLPARVLADNPHAVVIEWGVALGH